MKSYFLAGAKILGIYLVYLCLLNLFQAIAALIIFSSDSLEPFPMLTLVSSIGSLMILLLLSIFLLFKTDKVASILNIRDEQTNSNSKISIQAGIALIGIYVFSTKIGSFLANLYFQIKEANAGISGVGTYPNGPTFPKELLIATITIIFSLILIFRAKVVDNLISKLNQKRI
jgi:hypothetical protein